jgi:uncharacterized protein YegL
MRSDLTDITFVIDRSGSMEDIKTEMESTIKEILQSQQTGNDECRLSVYQFDSAPLSLRDNGLRLDKTVDYVRIADVKSVTIEPRGGTPLRDALCNVIDETGRRLSLTNEQDRPGKVVFVIVTDGMENTSKQYSWKDVENRVKKQESVYNWLFMYVGCNQDAIAEGQKMGLREGKSMTYKTSQEGMRGLAGSIGGKFSSIRGMSVDEYTSYNCSADVFDSNDKATQESA